MTKQKEKPLSRFGRTLLLILITVMIIAVLAGAGIAYAGYRITESETNLPNLMLDDILVGGLTPDQTVEKLRASGWDERLETPLTVKVPKDLSFSLNRLQSGAGITAEEAADLVFAYGHDGGWVQNLQTWLRARLSGYTELQLPEPKLNDTYIRANIRTVTEKYKELIGNGDILLDKDNARIVLTKGGGILHLDEDKLYDRTVSALLSGDRELNYTELEGELAPPDFESIYSDVAVEAKNASFTETFEVEKEVIGCTFDVEKAAALWEAAEPGEEVIIPLAIEQPEVTAEQLESLLFRDRLCFMTTHYGGSTDNRVNNIKLALSRLEGIIILPGETFSYNDTVGQRTVDAGFLSAPAYADGEVVEEIGGGICQVSSTLYCAAMYAQMTTVTRTNHYFAVNYLGMGYDATVSWPRPDYKFRNEREYPVQIRTIVDEENYGITIEFWGTNTDGSHVSPYTTTLEIYDEEYTDVVIGYGVYTYRRILDANDNLLRTIEEPYAIYHLHDENIAWPPEKIERDQMEALGEIVAEPDGYFLGIVPDN